MDASSSSATRRPSRKRVPTSIESLSHDIIGIIFSFLDDFVDVLRCSAVCKSWSSVIEKSAVFRTLYCKKQGISSTSHLDGSACLDKLLKIQLRVLAMDQHKLSLQEGSIDITQWKGHLQGADRCRMKMGLILTGGRDKVMRLWSVESYKCLDEFCLPDRTPLADFDFDETKVVGLLGTRICVWRRDQKRSIFASREGQFPKASCMGYVDPEAVVGCEDGRVRIFDMYSRRWSRIIKIHDGPVTCLSFSDDQLLIGGSSYGRISIFDLSSDQRVATLKSTDGAGLSTLCFNPSSYLLFGGSSAGLATCWDLRTLQTVWAARVSSNVLYSMHHLENDTTTLAIGGIDGVLRLLDQATGQVLSCCILDERRTKPNGSYGSTEKRSGRRIGEYVRIDLMPNANRPSINCLAVGMKKVVTTNGDGYIRVWKFNK